jgi:endonuclease YncB( thermonuclease family)
VDDGRTVWLGAEGLSPFRARLAWIAVPAAPSGNVKGERQGAEARQHLEVWKDRPVEFVTIGRDADGLPLLELLWRPTADSVITLNYEMVRSGFARADCAISGDYAVHCRLLRRAEDIARKERRGIWAVP